MAKKRKKTKRLQGFYYVGNAPNSIRYYRNNYGRFNQPTSVVHFGAHPKPTSGYYMWAHGIPVVGPFCCLGFAQQFLSTKHYKIKKHSRLVYISYQQGPHRLAGYTHTKLIKVPRNRKSKGFNRYHWLNWYQGGYHSHSILHVSKKGYPMGISLVTGYPNCPHCGLKPNNLRVLNYGNQYVPYLTPMVRG
jgi:hypothetical protein